MKTESPFANDLQLFQTLLRERRMPDVILLEGHKGIGKSSFLRQLAALHFCDQTSACGKCPSCQVIASNRHPDVTFIKEEGTSLKVEDIRDIADFLNFAPQGHSPYAKRIAVLCNVETMTRAAVNKLLKTLEEPSPYGRILLSTCKAKHLLPTLLSRCVRWRLRPHEGTLTKLRDQESKELSSFADQLLQLRDASPIISFCETIRPTIAPRLFDFIQEFEYSLNLLYRKALTDHRLDTASLRHRRKVLGELKDLVGHQRIALNPQLVLETLGFCNLKN
ncbi:MAG: hypothetical protein HYW48_01540 [Deltaproteobacteria bacterium]|nr:hypothetical protein [Deltaproteobacteria bacterium]